MKKFLTILISLSLVLNVIFWLPCSLSAKANTNDVLPLAIGKTTDGTLQKGEANRYLIESTGTGMLKITIKCYINDQLNASILSGKDKSVLINKTSFFDSAKKYSKISFSMYVNPSTFYLDLSNNIILLSGKYSITTSFTPLKSIDSGKNQSKKKALKLVNNTFNKGMLAVDDQTDFYYVSFKKSSQLILNIYALNHDLVRIAILDAKGEKLIDSMGGNSEHPFNINQKVPAGKYVIEISENSVDDEINGVNYCMITGKYTRIDKIKLPSTKSVTVGSKFALTPKITPKIATHYYTFSSSNSKIIAVKSNGSLVARRKGTAIITVSTPDGLVSSSCKVTVKSK